MAEEVNDLESHKHCIIIIVSVIKSLMVFLKTEETKACPTVLSCFKLLCTFSYLLNSAEAEDVKLHVDMRLADQRCVSPNVLPLKLAALVGRIRVVSEEWPGWHVRTCWAPFFSVNGWVYSCGHATLVFCVSISSAI